MSHSLQTQTTTQRQLHPHLRIGNLGKEDTGSVNHVDIWANMHLGGRHAFCHSRNGANMRTRIYTLQMESATHSFGTKRTTSESTQ